jgi:hypothetical protein
LVDDRLRETIEIAVLKDIKVMAIIREEEIANTNIAIDAPMMRARK